MSRKITNVAVERFLNAMPMKQGSMEIKVLPNVTVMLLHGNEIAYRYNDPAKTINITNAGWFSNTTKGRLNGLPGVRIQQIKGKWYLNGQLWDGEIIDINPDETV